MYRLLTALAVLALLLVPATGWADDGSSVQKLLDEGAVLYQKGKWNEAKKTYEKAYDKASDDSPLKAEAALEWSSLLWEQGFYQEASNRVDEALKLSKKLDLDQAVGRLLLTQGHIEASLGHLSSAENTLKICTEMAAEQSDDVFGSLCELSHRLVRQIRGQSVGPESEFKAAVEKLEKAGNPLAVGASLAKTAELYEKNGEHERALKLLRKAQDKFQEAGSVPAKRRNRLRFARVLQSKGDFSSAQAYLDGLVERFESMNNRPALVDAYLLVAQDAEHAGDGVAAREAYSNALEVAKKTGSPQMVARVSLGFCEFAGRRGAAGPATKHCTSAAQVFDKIGIPGLASRARAQLAGIAQSSGNLREASELYQEVISTLEDEGTPGVGSPSTLAAHRANLCQVELHLKSSGAYMLCREALGAIDKTDDSPRQMVAMTRYAVGITADRDDQPSKAIEHLEKAAELAPETDPPNWELAADAHLHRGAILARSSKRRNEAIADFRAGLEDAARGSGPNIEQSERQLRLQLAQVLLKVDRDDAAKKQLDKLVADSGLDDASKAWAYSALARIHARKGAADKAEKALETGLPLAKRAGDDDLVETFKENLKKFE